jgi:hypothetical protein
MNLAAALLLGHLIADFPLQTSWIYRYKTESWLGVVLHSAIHVLVTALLIRPLQATVPLLILLGILHFITDFTKSRLPAKRQSPGFLIDQFIHGLVLFLLAKLWQGTLYAVLPATLLLPLILYGSFLGLMVFLWVLACDLTKGQWGRYTLIQWAQRNLLKLSNYAGLALVLFLAQQWHRSPQATLRKFLHE